MSQENNTENNRGEQITLRVKYAEHEDVHFKIAKNMGFERLIQKYCDKLNLNPSQVNFVFEGTKINSYSTPSDY